MALAIPSLNKVQIGREAAKGTLVPATRLLFGKADIKEIRDYYRAQYNRGVRANTGGAGSLAMQAVEINVEQDLAPGQVLWPFLTGFRGNISPTGAGADKTWAFTPELTTALPTIDTATVEFVDSDGTTNHYYGEAGYCLTKSIALEYLFNAPVKLRYSMFGRARQTGTPTAALTLYATAQTPFMSNQATIFVDTTWAGLGGTQIQSLVRGLRIEIETGYVPDFTMDARADSDHTNFIPGPVTAKLTLLVEMDATAALRMAEYRANSIVFIRAKVIGAALGGSNYSVQIDGCYRFIETPERSEDDRRVLRSFPLESVYDETSGFTILPTVVDAITAVGGL